MKSINLQEIIEILQDSRHQEEVTYKRETSQCQARNFNEELDNELAIWLDDKKANIFEYSGKVMLLEDVSKYNMDDLVEDITPKCLILSGTDFIRLYKKQKGKFKTK